MDRDELKIKVRDAIWNLDSQSLQTGHWEDPLTYAEAALTAIEDAGWMPVPTKVLDRLADFNAVWDEAVEACIEAIEEETWRTKGADFSKSDLLRSLKRSDKTESDNGGCQVSSGAKGDTVSAAPLHSDIIAEAVRKVSWQPDAFNVRRDENGQIFVSADGQRRTRMSSDISKCADSFCPSKDHCHRFTAPASKVWQSWGDFQRKGEPCCDAYWPAVEPVTEKQDGS